MDSKKKINEEILRKRENDFTLGNVGAVKLPSYNALMDPNMRHYFENKHTQYLLYKTGQIDKHGRVIDLEKNKSKLFILEKEFATAEKLEEQRQKEEMEMRYRVQRKRFNELERLKKHEILQSLKAERELSKEIVSTLRLSQSSGSSEGKLSASKKNSSTFFEKTGEGFFITEK